MKIEKYIRLFEEFSSGPLKVWATVYWDPFAENGDNEMFGGLYWREEKAKDAMRSQLYSIWKGFRREGETSLGFEEWIESQEEDSPYWYDEAGVSRFYLPEDAGNLLVRIIKSTPFKEFRSLKGAWDVEMSAFQSKQEMASEIILKVKEIELEDPTKYFSSMEEFKAFFDNNLSWYKGDLSELERKFMANSVRRKLF
jgi:hypothetical protein